MLDQATYVVLLFLEPAGEEVQRLERAAEGRRRRRHLEPRRPHVDGGCGAHHHVVRRHAEVVQLPQRVLRPPERLHRRGTSASGGLYVVKDIVVVAWTGQVKIQALFELQPTDYLSCHRIVAG